MLLSIVKRWNVIVCSSSIANGRSSSNNNFMFIVRANWHGLKEKIFFFSWVSLPDQMTQYWLSIVFSWSSVYFLAFSLLTLLLSVWHIHLPFTSFSGKLGQCLTLGYTQAVLFLFIFNIYSTHFIFYPRRQWIYHMTVSHQLDVARQSHDHTHTVEA